MKRIGWLILLISLGLNLGLGLRLMNRMNSDQGEWSDSRGGGVLGKGFRDGGPEGRPWRQGRGENSGRPHGGFSGQRRGDFFRPASGDSGAWRVIMEQRLERITQRLNLDPLQVESFRATHLQAGSRFRIQRLEIETAEERLFALASRNPVEPDSIRAAVQDLGRRKAVLDSLVTEAMLKELDSLNPEQRGLYLRILPWSRPGGREAGRPGRR